MRKKLSELDKQYIEGYRKYPEDHNETLLLFRAGLESFSKENWDEAYLKWKRSNRPNKHKDKKSSGCGLCKPHKHGGRAMKDKERLNLKALHKKSSN